MGVDLNPTPNAKEVWGETTRVDRLANYFSILFEELNLVVVEPMKIMPTWRNSRSSRAGILKCLDRFLMVVKVLEEITRYKYWVGIGGYSDHPIANGKRRSKVSNTF